MADFDVIVVGGGLAGVSAALAAKSAGAKVALAARSMGATALSTGALDIAYSPRFDRDVTPQDDPERSHRPLMRQVEDIVHQRARHPYGMLGGDKIQEGTTAGAKLLLEASSGEATPFTGLEDINWDENNLLWPSSLGTLLPIAASWFDGKQGNFAKGGKFSVLNIPTLAHFCVNRLVAGWTHDARRRGIELDLEVITVDIESINAAAARGPMALAFALDDEELRGELCAALAGRCDKKSQGLLMPPVLGFDSYQRIHSALETAAGCPIFEALAHLPSVPGARLGQALWRILESEGIVRLGEISLKTSGRKITHVVAVEWPSQEQSSQEYSAENIVLATGRFVSGGIDFIGPCREPLLNLPTVTVVGPMEDVSPLPVVRETPVESHPLLTAGLWVDEQLRPLHEGEIAFDNLYAAGMIIGGFASRYVLCADGVALATGYWAGLNAAKSAAGRPS